MIKYVYDTVEYYRRVKLITNVEYGNIYVLLDEQSEDGPYKIGITSRNLEDLLRDYKRSRPRIISKLFLTNVKDYQNVERKILNHYKDNRIPTQAGRLSEWVQGVSLESLISYVTDVASGNNLDIEDFHMVPDLIPPNIKNYIKKFYILDLSHDYLKVDIIYEHYRNEVHNPIIKQQFCKYLIKYISIMLNTDIQQIKGKLGYRYIKFNSL